MFEPSAYLFGLILFVLLIWYVIAPLIKWLLLFPFRLWKKLRRYDLYVWAVEYRAKWEEEIRAWEFGLQHENTILIKQLESAEKHRQEQNRIIEYYEFYVLARCLPVGAISYLPEIKDRARNVRSIGFDTNGTEFFEFDLQLDDVIAWRRTLHKPHIQPQYMQVIEGDVVPQQYFKPEQVTIHREGNNDHRKSYTRVGKVTKYPR